MSDNGKLASDKVLVKNFIEYFNDNDERIAEVDYDFLNGTVKFNIGTIF